MSHTFDEWLNEKDYMIDLINPDLLDFNKDIA
jgi:hypothetical protein